MERFIHELEKKELHLSATISLPENDDLATPEPPVVGSNETRDSTKTVDTPSSVLQGGGLRLVFRFICCHFHSPIANVFSSFMSLLFADEEWRRTNAVLLHTLARASRAAEPVNEASQLPSIDDARFLFDK